MFSVPAIPVRGRTFQLLLTSFQQQQLQLVQLSTVTSSKRLNLCNAVNEALFIALEQDAR